VLQGTSLPADDRDDKRRFSGRLSFIEMEHPHSLPFALSVLCVGVRACGASGI
jgi:hypothetical protein